MKARSILVAGALVMALGVFAVMAGAATHKKSATTVDVWLMTDAKGWPDIVDAANKAFQAAHPGVNVNVTYLTWGEHLGKLDAALAAGNAPDVTEMGNTEMTKYMAAGAFYVLPASHFDNYKTWLNSLQQSATFGEALWRSVLRRCPRGHHPHGLLEEVGREEASAGDARRVLRRRSQDHEEVRQE